MRRDIDALKNEEFDLLIVGGGITGAATAWDASLRGLKTALIEKKDFGHATSAATTKMIHGGLRYLAMYEFSVVRDSLRERRRLEKNLPHLAFPLPFLLPIYKGRGTSRWLLKLGLSIYDTLAFDKNYLDDPDKHLPNHVWLSRKDTLMQEPGLDPDDLIGAFCYYDVLNRYPERSNLEYVLSASNHGATCANYVEALSFLTTPGEPQKVKGVEAKDLNTGKKFSIKAKTTINATGPWVDKTIAKLAHKQPRKIIRSKGIHLLLPGPAPNDAMALETETGRHLFIIPWENYTLIGTTDTPFTGDLDELRVNKSETLELLDVANRHYPAKWSYHQVLHAYCGVRPLIGKPGEGSKTYGLSRKHEIYDHSKDGFSGLVSVLGGKWTTSRSLAASLLDHVVKTNRFQAKPCNTADTPLDAGLFQRRYSHYLEQAIRKYSDRHDEELIKRLVSYYGCSYEKILHDMERKPALKKPISSSHPHTLAELHHAVEQESAFTLEDFFMRRTTLGNTGGYDGVTVKNCAAAMGKVLGWSPAIQKKQIKEFLARVQIFDDLAPQKKKK